MKLELLPILMRIASKLDIRPLVNNFKGLDIIRDGQKANQLTREQGATIVFELFADLLPQLTEDIGKDIIALVAAHKEISVKEAGKLDMMQAAKEILAERGVLDFFIKRLKMSLAPK
jgi:hypothetical protein